MATRAVRRPIAAPTPDHRLTLILAFAFGAVFLAALLALAVVIPNPTQPQFEIFRIIIALAAGGVAAVIPGLMDLRFGQGGRFALRAGGALAVFAVVYFYSPAHWVANTGSSSVRANRDSLAVGRDLNNSQGQIVIGAPPPATKPDGPGSTGR